MKKLYVILTFAALTLAGCGGGSNGGASNGENTVSMTGVHSFSPVNLTVHAGDVVTWKNTDSANHTVTSDTGTANLDSSTQFPSGLPGQATFQFTVPAGTAAGTVFYYHCAFHGAAGDGAHLGTGMAGSITVQ